MARKRKKKADFPAWQPDFRIGEDLPDIKAVRTDFLVNIGAVTLAVVMIFWLVYREAFINGLANELERLEDVRQQLEGENRRIVGLNARFMKKKQIVDDLERFYSAPFDVPKFLGDIARIRPAEIAFDEISFREEAIGTEDERSRVFRINFRGQTQSLSVVDDFKDSFTELSYLADMDVVISEGANPRNPALNTFGFSLDVDLEPREEE